MQSLQRIVSQKDWAIPKRSFVHLWFSWVCTRSQKSSTSSYDVLPAYTKHVIKDVIYYGVIRAAKGLRGCISYAIKGLTESKQTSTKTKQQAEQIGKQVRQNPTLNKQTNKQQQRKSNPVTRQVTYCCSKLHWDTVGAGPPVQWIDTAALSKQERIIDVIDNWYNKCRPNTHPFSDESITMQAVLKLYYGAGAFHMLLRADRVNAKGYQRHHEAKNDMNSHGLPCLTYRTCLAWLGPCHSTSKNTKAALWSSYALHTSAGTIFSHASALQKWDN